jgi:dTDP-glucose 4,6-dehydratase
MNLVIAGGLGFIGTNYVKRILDGTLSGVSKIRVIDKHTYAADLSNFSESELQQFEIINGDICSESQVLKSFKGMDSLVNFAAESHVDRSIVDPIIFLKTNVLGISVLLQSALQCNVNNIVQISTDEVYGTVTKGSRLESDFLNPSSPYSASKASADLICKSFSKTYGMSIKITRSSNNYGPYQYPEKLIPLSIIKLLSNQKLSIYGNGKNKRSWLHVDDNCQGIHKVLINGRSGEIYNIGGGSEISNLELVRIILRYFNKNDSYLNFIDDRKGHDFRYSINWNKAKNELNYYPVKNFSEGLIETIKWYEKYLDWWLPKL